MRVQGVYEKCRIYIESQNIPSGERTHQFPCITISRQTCTRADIIGHKVVEIMNRYSVGEDTEWTYFDKNLIEKVVEDHNLPQILSKLMDEDKVYNLKNIMNEIFGVHPSGRVFVRKVSETILQIAKLGRAVIIGRGANIIASRLKNVFNVRLVAPVEFRAKQAQEAYDIDNYNDAVKFIVKEDASRKNYLRTYFGKDIEDPLLYHIVLNTSALGFDQTAELIALSVVKRFSEVYYQSIDR
jgi:cytidylate kinase